MRGSLSVGVWLLATGTAVGVSWLGVRSALVGSTPAAVPAVTLPMPSAVATAIAPTTTAGTPDAAKVTRVPTAAPTTPSAHPATAATGATTATTMGQVNQYPTAGGVVVLSLTASGATLITATPASGYSVSVWHGVDWLRVDFTSSGATWTVLAAWNGQPPSVQTYQS